MARIVLGLNAEQRKEQRKTALLDAALELFSSLGYSSTSIEQLCHGAGISTKSFYGIFADREQCYLALMHRCAADLTARMELALKEAPEDEHSGRDKLVSAFAHAFGDDRRRAIVLFGYGSAFTPTIEVERRKNRRIAETLLLQVWQRYRPGYLPAPGMTTGMMGGLLAIISSWASNEMQPAAPDVHHLHLALHNFYRSIRLPD